MSQERSREGFNADLGSPAFASQSGGLPRDFAGVVVNLRVEDRSAVDATFDRALSLGAEGEREPYDAFWGTRYAVVRASVPIAVGIMSPADRKSRGEAPSLPDFT